MVQFAKLNQTLQKYSISSANLLNQGIVMEALETGIVDDAVRHYQKAVSNKMKILYEELDSMGILNQFDIATNGGGFYYWLKSKNPNFDSSQQLSKAREFGVSYVPGEIYFNNKTPDTHSFIRLTASQIPEECIKEAVNILSKSLE